MSSVTEVTGLFSNCGPGIDNYEISYTCKGPSCHSITGFQDISCTPSTNDEPGVDFTCSNGFECPQGISSYQSNFTFSQNAPDPIDPPPNDFDSRVHQYQNVLLPECRKFSVDSDGSNEGTSTSDIETEPDCEDTVQSSPILSSNSKASTTFIVATFLDAATSSDSFDYSASSNVFATSYTTSSSHSATTGYMKESMIASSWSSSSTGLIHFSGSGSWRRSSWRVSIMVLLFWCILFIPGAQSRKPQRDLELDDRSELHVRAAAKEVRRFALQLDATLAQKANAVGEDGDTIAHNLVADIIESVCGAFFRGGTVGGFAPKIVGDCVRTIYNGNRVPEPGVQFLAVFGGSLLCDYVVSEAFPIAEGFSADGCRGLEDLARRVGSNETQISSTIPSDTAMPTSSITSANATTTSLATVIPLMSESSEINLAEPSSALLVGTPSEFISASGKSSQSVFTRPVTVSTSTSMLSDVPPISSLGRPEEPMLGSGTLTSMSVSFQANPNISPQASPPGSVATFEMTASGSVQVTSMSNAGTPLSSLPGTTSSGLQPLATLMSSQSSTTAILSGDLKSTDIDTLPESLSFSSLPPFSVTSQPSEFSLISLSSIISGSSELSSSAIVSAISNSSHFSGISSSRPPPILPSRSLGLLSSVTTADIALKTGTVTIIIVSSELSFTGTTSPYNISNESPKVSGMTSIIVTNSSAVSETSRLDSSISTPSVSDTRVPSLSSTTTSESPTFISSIRTNSSSFQEFLTSSIINISTGLLDPLASNTSVAHSKPACDPGSLATDLCPIIGCTNLYADRLNCGSCNNTCDWRCSYGVCICPGDLSLRQDGRACCDPGWAINSDTDRCEPVCPAGWSFDVETGECRRNGGTQLPTTTLTVASSPTTLISSYSITSFSPTNTTASPTMIVANTTSLGTVTTRLVTDLLPATVICSSAVPWLCFGKCVNIYYNTENCGICGNVCQYGCSAGKCVCLEGQHKNADDICVNDTPSEPATIASGYLSVSSTSSGQESTPTSIADSEESPSYCFDIYNEDALEECAGLCVSLLSDDDNCGSCGSICSGNLTCQSGECVEPVGSFIWAGLGG